MESPAHIDKRIKKQTPSKTPSKRLKLEALSVEQLVERYKDLCDKDRKLTEELAVWSTKGLKLDLGEEMRALHKYNDMKDFAQVVLGCLSDVEQVTVRELHERYNLPSE